MRILQMRIPRFAVAVATLLLLAVSATTATAFYNPQTGRWLSRDPIGEQGGINLHSFVQNDPGRGVDSFGLIKTFEGCSRENKQAIENAERAAKGGLEFMQRRLADLVGSGSQFQSRYPDLFNRTSEAPSSYNPTSMYADWYGGMVAGMSAILQQMSENSVSAKCCGSCAEFHDARAAYVVRGSKVVSLCPSFFTLTPKQQRAAILHEFSHSALGTSDSPPADFGSDWKDFPKDANHWGGYLNPGVEAWLDTVFKQIVTSVLRGKRWIN